jgi:methylated-DNA-[protein]-cysteine S-methyltransferase
MVAAFLCLFSLADFFLLSRHAGRGPDPDGRCAGVGGRALCPGRRVADAAPPSTPLLAETARQLTEYFAGQRQRFELPLAAEGSAFQQRVWAELRALPYGATTTYSALARRLGDALAVRAVGRANATNPLAIVVPCHRVVGTGGKLTGFVGGTEVKQWLLRHEARHSTPEGLFAVTQEADAAA